MKPTQHSVCCISVIANVEKTLLTCSYIMLFFCLLVFFCLSTFMSQLPNGVTYHPNTHQDRLGKLQEHLRMLSVLFRKLRLVYDKCNENCAGLESIPPEVTIAFTLCTHSTRSKHNNEHVVEILTV